MTISKIIITSIKSGLLASFILITLIMTFEKNVGNEFLLIYFFSLIITSIISFCMIVFTIVPFTAFIKEKVFEKVFPYYSILFFFGMLTINSLSKFNKELLYITFSAFITAMMAWIWLFKEDKLEDINDT